MTKHQRKYILGYNFFCRSSNLITREPRKMLPRSVNPLNKDKLEALTTKRLLTYLHSLQQCEESIVTSDWNEDEVASVRGIIFKTSDVWKLQYSLVKAVLAERPKIE